MQNTPITVNEDLQAYIDPLTPDEYAALERSLLAEGCRDALVLWGDVLVDGHNRHAICQKHGLPFQTVQNTRFTSLEDVHLWMIDQHLGRRSVSDFQRGVLALRKKDLVAERRSRALARSTGDSSAPTADPADADTGFSANTTEPLHSREDIARAARLSSSQVVMIEKIQKQAAPEVVAALKAGSISLNAAAAVASLPADEQVAAAHAGKDELKQAAKRVRESRRKPKAAEDVDAPEAKGAPALVTDAAANGSLHALQQRVAELTAENGALRQQIAALQAERDSV